jgi:hypothetical protein
MTGLVETVSWSPADMTYVGVGPGEFGGTLICNEDDAVSQGTLSCTAARTTPVGVPLTTLLELTVEASLTLEPGACVSVQKDLSELSGAAGEDFLPQLEVQPAYVGVRPYAFGDVNSDGNVGAADAVQCLRDLVDLPVCQTCDLAMCDVDRDGTTSSTDAVYILRSLVDLGLPQAQRVGRHGLAACELP